MLGSALESPAGDDLESEQEPHESRPTTQSSDPRRLRRRLGDYELLNELGHGGMGVVYRARQVSLNRIVALKTMLLGIHASEDAIQRFRREAEAIAALHHPGIVAIHAIGESGGEHYFAMDLVEGIDLATKIRRQPLQAREAARYAFQIVRAIQYAHEKGILHRDLKPSNILIDINDEVRITDFGLAKRMDGTADLTLTGQVIGSPNYFPPEQAAGQFNRLTPASDVYSIGAILYEMLTARPPFLAESLQDTLILIRSADPVAPRFLNPALPQDLETTCLKCLEKDPSRRYSTAKKLAEELERFLDGRPIIARPIGALEKSARWASRNRSTAYVLALLVLTLVTATIVSSWLAIHAVRASENARIEAGISKEVNQFYNEDILKSASPSRGGTRDIRLLDVLEQAARKVDERQFEQPLVEAAIRSAIGQAFTSLNKYSKAEPQLTKAHAILLARRGAEDRERVRSAIQLGTLYHQQGKFDLAESLLAEVYAIQVRRFGEEDADTLGIMRILAPLRADRTGFDQDSRKFFEHTLALQRKVLGTKDWVTRATMTALAKRYSSKGQHAEAITLLEETIGAASKEHSPEGVATFWPRLELAQVFIAQSRWSEAEAVARSVIRDQESVYDPGHVMWIVPRSLLSVACMNQSKFSDAAQCAMQAWDHGPPTYRENTRSSMETLLQSCQTHGLETEAAALKERLRDPATLKDPSAAPAP